MSSPKGIIKPFQQLYYLLTKHWELTLEISRREVTERYSGQFFGAFWVFAHPLFMIGLYVFVFSAVLEMKTEGLDKQGVDYAVYLLAGLIPWMAFQEAMSKGCYAVSGNASLVKQVVFPLEVLPFKSVVTAVLNQILASSLMFAYLFFAGLKITYFALLFPLLFILQVLAMLGFSYFLSAVSIFVKDTKDFVQLFSVAGLFLIPVFYLPDWVPEMFKPIVMLNPFSHMVWCYQDIIVYGAIQHPNSWIVFSIFSFFSFVMGLKIFNSLKPVFGNVL